MKWREAKLEMEIGETREFAFCGFQMRKSMNGKQYEAIYLDRDMSYWIPVFAVEGANISMDEARKHKGNVIVSALKDQKYELKFLAA